MKAGNTELAKMTSFRNGPLTTSLAALSPLAGASLPQPLLTLETMCTISCFETMRGGRGLEGVGGGGMQNRAVIQAIIKITVLIKRIIKCIYVKIINQLDRLTPVAHCSIMTLTPYSK